MYIISVRSIFYQIKSQFATKSETKQQIGFVRATLNCQLWNERGNNIIVLYMYRHVLVMALTHKCLCYLLNRYCCCLS